MNMTHLLTGVAMVVALAISGPVSAQPANAPGGDSMSGPGMTSATPPTHRRASAHHATHGRMVHGPKSVTDTASQLNQAELARLQQGAPASAPPSSSPQMHGGMGAPGQATGAPGSTPYSTGFPHESEHGTVQR